MFRYIIKSMNLKMSKRHTFWNERSTMEREWRSVMKNERSVITITLYWHSSQVYNLDNRVDDTPTETDLTSRLLHAHACPSP